MGDLRRARHDDRDRALDSVLCAFRADPALRWFWPSDERYAACAASFFGLLLDLRLEGGEVWVVDGGDAVAMWNPPGGLYGEPAEGRWAEVREGFTEAERDRLATFDSALGVPGSAGPHWFLGVLATRPDRQRAGLGRAVVAPMLRASDRVGLPAYLETAGEANVAFYRGLGFAPEVETTLPAGPRCWLMRRDPGAVS